VTPSLRVALFGSPSFAVPVLERLHAEHRLVLAVAQPDKPAGRGLRARRPAVARRADELGVPVLQPARLRRDEGVRARLREADLDVAVTAAYGKILPADLLDVPRHGFLNAHASLLPELRGAAPIQWALIRGHRQTGVTVMQTEPGLDTGPIRHVRRTAIEPDETAPELSERLARLAAEAMAEALRLLAEGRLPSEPQDDRRASQAPLLRKEDGHVRWRDPARAVVDRWRGVRAWPGSRFAHGDRRVRADRLALAAEAGREGAPGEVVEVGPEGLRVACGEGAVELREVTPPGRRAMPAAAWARGAGVKAGDRLA
jgi:methionyl-tRNA formyltransferase